MEVPHIVVDICGASEDDSERFAGRDADFELERGKPKYTPSVGDAESIA